MSKGKVAAILGGFSFLIMACAAGIVMTVVTALIPTATPAHADVCGDPAPVATGGTATGVTVAGFSADQVRNATTIVNVGQQMKIHPRGWVIAIGTALQESNLRNLGNLGAANDHDSLGLFQQRPSQGWGSAAETMDPAHASTSFYTALLKISGWEQMPLTVAAQAVQRSAFPSAYAKHEPAAARLVSAITNGADKAADTPGQCAPVGVVNAGGWVTPVAGGVISKFRPPSRPTHYGVDLEAEKHTAIHVAAAGTVIKAICDPATIRTRGSCDVDGSPETLGCGWYVDVAHPDGIMTRYCHMIQQPMVTAGQQLTAGQQIGWSGTSGNSSGPHVHFEVHIGGDRTKNGATDPEKFMREHGAPLGAA